MSGPYPSTDPRRRPELLQQLEAAATRLLPAWRGITEPDDPGRAVLQIAAVLAEHVTSRLDATAERDLKAFLRWLDLPGPEPTSAEAWAVFTLTDKRDSAVQVREPIQMSGPGSNGDEVFFETPDTLPLTLTPARLETAFSVDPSRDRIEAAPPGFGSLEPPVASDPRYELFSFAAEGSKQIQITPPIGVTKGDWVRIDGASYAIEDEKDGIYTIDPGLDAAAAAGALVSRVTRFEPGAMRSLQRHAFYLGHKELLNLEQAASIDLHFEPVGVERWLVGREVSWEIWGTKDDEDTSDWIALEAALGASSVRLRKSWIGKTEEREVDGQKSRWLRARLREPLVDEPLSFRCDRITLKISSEAPKPNDPSPQAQDAGGNAPPTVTAGFHNANPLPVNGRFLPFGPEPRLFDQFYLAAPETLSKRGAKAAFDLKLADASIMSISGVRGEDGTYAAFGVSGHGHLQFLRARDEDSFVWTDLGRPGAIAGPSDPNQDADVALDGRHQPAVIPFADDGAENLRYLVAASGADARIWTTLVTFNPENKRASTEAWRRTDGDLIESHYHDLVALPRASGHASSAAGYLFRADAHGLWRADILSDGSSGPWHELENSGTAPEFGKASRLVAVQTTDWPAPTDSYPYQLVLIDEKGHRWLGEVPGDKAVWTSLELNLGVAGNKVRPTASRLASTGDLYVLTATQGHDAVDLYSRNSKIKYLGQSQTIDIVEGSAIKSVLRNDSSPRLFSLVRVTDAGRPAIALFDGIDFAKQLDAAPKAPWDTITTAWLEPDENAVRLTVAGQKEATFQCGLGLEQMDIESLQDAVILESETETAHYIAVSNGVGERFIKLGQAVLHDQSTNRRIYAVDQTNDLAPGETYVFFRRVASHSNGEILEADRLELDPGDTDTKLETLIAVGGAVHRISDIDTSGISPVAKVSPDLTGTGPIGYEVLQTHGAPQDVTRHNINALAELDTVKEVMPIGIGDTLLYRKDINAPLVMQTIRDLRSAGGTKFDIYIDGDWDPPVSGNALPVYRLGSAGPGSWDPVPFSRSYQNPELTWEYYDGSGWRRLQEGFFDGTEHLVVSGKIGFKVPADFAQTEIAGREDYWIRARLIGGDYGQPIYQIESIPVEPDEISISKITIDRSELAPPEIRTIDASFVLTKSVAPELTLVDNNLALVDQTAAAAAEDAVFGLFAAAATLDREVAVPTLYIAFSKPFTADALRLLVDAAEQEGDVRLLWEAFAEGEWQNVRVSGEDPTQGLLRPGLITLQVRIKPTRHALFGRASYWLRARPVKPVPWKPDVKGIYPNAAPAEQAKTIRSELLGSTTGEPNARFDLAEQPVLRGSLELRVRERLGSEERAALIEKRGDVVILSDLPDIPGDWVLWQEVETFVDQDPDARVFLLDPRTGMVRFGDDRHGRIPPAGADNVRAFKYQAGGGQNGNLDAYTLTSLKSSVTGVEAVTNPLPARGGSNGRDDVASCAQAVAEVRHLNRVITPQDVEALALDYAPEIVRARCVRPSEPGAQVIVAVAIAGSERAPKPSLSLQYGLAQYLTERATSSWPDATFDVVGPEFVQLRLKVELAQAPDSPATLPSLVHERLLAFLHPVTGEYDGRGWPFGRGLWRSDVYRVLADTLGEARIVQLEIARVEDGGAANAVGPTAVITAGRDDIEISLSGTPR